MDISRWPQLPWLHPPSTVNPSYFLQFRRSALVLHLAWLLRFAGIIAAAEGSVAVSAGDTPWRLSVFQADVTPPLGHPLLAIGSGDPRAVTIKDRLLAKGLVLHGPAQPIVLVAVDWCELRNDAYARWRDVLAAAAGTTVQRVLVSCLHQHDAPYFDLTAQKLLAASPGGGTICDLDFHESIVQKVAKALTASLPNGRNVTHLGIGQARVDQVASSRRVVLPESKVTFSRPGRTTSAVLRSLPDGEIDPWLKSLSFWEGDQPLVVVSSYACHPMSYYGAGEVSADFVGMARARREQDTPGVLQIYLTGCSGDVTAGKYNDGSPANRRVLADRLYDAMTEAARRTTRHPVQTISCRAVPMLLPHSELPALQPDALQRQLADANLAPAKRVHAALGLSSLQRSPTGHRIEVQAIDFGHAQMVLLPAESFVAYQLFAQRLRPESLVMGIGFGECAPGYIPTEQAFREGYREEHGYCWVAPGAEKKIEEALQKALAPP